MVKFNSTSLDLIRVTAIFAVIMIHTTAGPFKVSSDSWWAINVYMSLSRWCVPVLFMLSGALLIGKQEELSSFFKKRVSKIILPFIFWSYVYILFSRNFSYLDPAHADPNALMNPLKLLNHPAYFHLWFIYAIIGVYLTLPLIRLASNKKSILLYVSILWFIGTSLIPFLITFNILQGNPFYLIKLDFIFRYSGLAVVGYLLVSYINYVKLTHGIFLFFIGFLSTLLLTAMASKWGASPTEMHQDYFTPNVIIMSAGAFVCLYKLGELIKNSRMIKIASYLSALSFGMYLVHMLVMPLVWKIPMLGNIEIIGSNNLAYFLVPISAAITFLVSFLIILVFYKTPFLRKLI